MSDDALRWIEAGMADADVVLALMRAFYAEERLVFSEEVAGAAVRELLARRELGRVFLLKCGNNGTVCGHLVLTWGFSLEFRGRYVLLDELYVTPGLRGQGWGRQGIEFAAAWAREHGASSLRLEVNHANTHAKAVYLRRGFGDDRRDLMTRWL